VSVPRDLPDTTLADVLRRIDAATAALPARPDRALRELSGARSLLAAPLHPLPAASTPTAGDARLTLREREVLGLLAEGDRNKEIAVRLGLSERTVKFHVANVLRKLDAQSRTEALRRAIELGLLGTGGMAGSK
jgi:DNA-binding NarL/FixJ family response regulator